MSLFSRRSSADPFLPSGGIGWLLASSSGILVFLTVVAVFLSSVALQISQRWSNQLVETAIIQLPFAPEADLVRFTDAIEIVLDRTPGIVGYDYIKEEDLRLQLEEWLGAEAQSPDISLPRLIRLTLGDVPLDVSALNSQLSAVAPGSVFDDHSELRVPLSRSTLVLRVIAFGSVGLLVFALTVLIWLTMRTALATNLSSIEIVSGLGATEKFIRDGLLKRYLGLVVVGALAGSVCATGVIYGVPEPANDAALLAGFRPSLAEWLTIGTVPTSIILLAYSIIRQTIVDVFSKIP